MARRSGGWKWWSARILVRSHSYDPASEGDLWEHSILLIRARNEAEAKRRAKSAARSREAEYVGGTGYRVRWRFDQVLEVYELLDDRIADGVEVHSLFGRGVGRRRPADPMAEWTARGRFEREFRRPRRRR